MVHFLNNNQSRGRKGEFENFKFCHHFENINVVENYLGSVGQTGREIVKDIVIAFSR